MAGGGMRSFPGSGLAVRFRTWRTSGSIGAGRDDLVSKEITVAIKVWWLALKAHHDVSDEKLAQLIEATAWRAGAKSVQPLNRQNVSTWRSRGSFPPMDASLQSAVVQLMAAMAREIGAPDGVGGWIDVAELYRAWMASRAGLEEAPHARTLEANKRKVQGLADVLVDDPERTVEEATSLEGLRDGFWQGSWVTGNEAPPYVPRSIGCSRTISRPQIRNVPRCGYSRPRAATRWPCRCLSIG